MPSIFSPPPAYSGDVHDEDKVAAIICHAFWLAALVIWISNKEKPEKAWLVDQAKEALNFGITALLIFTFLFIVFGILGLIPLIGILTSVLSLFVFMALALAVFTLIVLAVIDAANLKAHRYFFSMRLVQ